MEPNIQILTKVDILEILSDFDDNSLISITYLSGNIEKRFFPAKVTGVWEHEGTPVRISR